MYPLTILVNEQPNQSHRSWEDQRPAVHSQVSNHDELRH